MQFYNIYIIYILYIFVYIFIFSARPSARLITLGTFVKLPVAPGDMQQFCDAANCLCISLMKCKERKLEKRLRWVPGIPKNPKLVDVVLLFLLTRRVVIKYLSSLWLFALKNSQNQSGEWKCRKFPVFLLFVLHILANFRYLNFCFGICYLSVLFVFVFCGLLS